MNIKDRLRNMRLSSIWQWAPLHNALMEADVAYVRGYCAGTWGVDVSPRHAAEWCLAAARYTEEGRRWYAENHPGKDLPEDYTASND